MTAAEYDAQWQCALCEEWKATPSLARHCEEKHLAEAEEIRPQ